MFGKVDGLDGWVDLIRGEIGGSRGRYWIVEWNEELRISCREITTSAIDGSSGWVSGSWPDDEWNMQ